MLTKGCEKLVSPSSPETVIGDEIRKEQLRQI